MKEIIELLEEVANWNEDYSSTLIKIRAKKLLAQLEQTAELKEHLHICNGCANTKGCKKIDSELVSCSDYTPQPEGAEGFDKWLSKEYPLFWDDMGQDMGLGKQTIASIVDEYATQQPTAQAQSVEREDADLLSEIYERNDMQVIANSDIYLRGFQDGLTYKKDKSHGNPGVCPDCGSGVYNCKCQ